MNNKTLAIIFAALLAVFLISKLFSGNKQRSFDPDIVHVDSSAVTKIILTPKAEEGQEVILSKSAGQWTAEKGGLIVKTPYDKVSSLLRQMGLITAKRVVSNTPDKWSDYEVGPRGSGIKVMAGSKVLVDFIVGTFKFDQVNRSASSYIRLTDGDEVYLVDGFMSMQFNQGFNAFRNSVLVKMNREDLRQLTLESTGQAAGIELNEDGQWYFGGMEHLDSTQMAQYVTGLTSAFGSEYIDDISTFGAPVKTLRMSGNNMLAPIEVECYASGDTLKPFVLHSSTNPDSYFLSDSAGLYNRIFGKLEKLLQER